MDHLEAMVAARRFRPLARLRRSTDWPVAVFIRWRNPCLRRLFVRLGWYVRFIV